MKEWLRKWLGIENVSGRVAKFEVAEVMCPQAKTQERMIALLKRVRAIEVDLKIDDRNPDNIPDYSTRKTLEDLSEKIATLEAQSGQDLQELARLLANDFEKRLLALEESKTKCQSKRSPSRAAKPTSKKA